LDRLADPVYCVDLAKNVFEVHTFARSGACTRTERLSRRKFAAKFTNAHTPRGTLVMEACGSANYWNRRFAGHGYGTVLVPAQFVAKRRVGNKNDGNDADAIYAVYRDPRIQPVPVKTLKQQDLAALHRVRELLVSQRTQCMNQIRGLLGERGAVEPTGPRGLHRLLQRINQEDLPQVTPSLQYLVAIVHEHLDQIQSHLKCVEQELEHARQGSALAQRVQTIFGVGPVTATACVAEYAGGVDRFRDSRQFAASLGITPREHSSGEKRRRGAVTRRGNPYLRTLLVQCANIIVNLRNRRDDALCKLARHLMERGKRRSVVVVAIANRLARSIYAVIKHETVYTPTGRPTVVASA